LEVANRVHANLRHDRSMPHPLSDTVTSSPLEVTSIAVDDASKLFSMSSLIMAQGRCITSPAAIRSIVCGGRGNIGAIVLLCSAVDAEGRELDESK
jgi:hypothetical protein